MINLLLCGNKKVFDGALTLCLSIMRRTKEPIKERKLLFADQDALFWNTTKKKILPRIYNEQSRFNDERTIICHFAKRLMLWPFPPRTENYKQWHVKEVHEVLKCHRFDKDLEEYLNRKKEFEEGENDEK